MSTPSPSYSPSNSPSPPEPPPPSSTPQPAVRKPHPAPWSHDETVLLIQAYQEKWYALKRGQLKAGQWEELAATLSARFGYPMPSYAKSPIQCRHKMEKLRRRYREEKRRVSSCGSSVWPFFDYMDSLEHGPLPVPARPPPLIPRRENNTNDGIEEDDEEEDEEEEEEEDYGHRSKSRSINYILRKPSLVNRFAGSGSGSGSGSGTYQEELMRKRRREREEEEEGRRGFGLGLAEEIRTFTERMMKVERKKMMMMRETERWRMEMENKRIEMILDSQRKMVDMIAAAAADDDDMGSRQEIKD